MTRLPTPSGPTSCASGPGYCCEAIKPANCSQRPWRVSPNSPDDEVIGQTKGIDPPPNDAVSSGSSRTRARIASVQSSL